MEILQDSRQIDILHVRVDPDGPEILDTRLIFSDGNVLVFEDDSCITLYGSYYDGRVQRPVAYYYEGNVYVTETSQNSKFQVMVMG